MGRGKGGEGRVKCNVFFLFLILICSFLCVKGSEEKYKDSSRSAISVFSPPVLKTRVREIK